MANNYLKVGNLMDSKTDVVTLIATELYKLRNGEEEILKIQGVTNLFNQTQIGAETNISVMNLMVNAVTQRELLVQLSDLINFAIITGYHIGCTVKEPLPEIKFATKGNDTVNKINIGKN